MSKLLPLLSLLIACGSPDRTLDEEPLFGGSSAATSTGGVEPVGQGGTDLAGAPTSSGGTANMGGRPQTGGSLSTGGSPATGGSVSPSGGSVSQTGGNVSPSGGSVSQTGGSVSVTGGNSAGGTTGGQTLQTGGSAGTGSTGSTSLGGCGGYQAGRGYQIGETVQSGTGYYTCTGPLCGSRSPQEDDVYSWRKTTCGAGCVCGMGCNAPTVGYQDTGSRNEPFTAYPEYLAAVSTGWLVRVQRADSCDKNGSCLYYADFAMMSCSGSAEDCRRRDPRFESCTGLLGANPPCRSQQIPADSPWTVVNPKCPK